jgi:hypothetical protein
MAIVVTGVQTEILDSKKGQVKASSLSGEVLQTTLNRPVRVAAGQLEAITVQGSQAVQTHASQLENLLVEPNPRTRVTAITCEVLHDQPSGSRVTSVTMEVMRSVDGPARRKAVQVIAN